MANRLSGVLLAGVTGIVAALAGLGLGRSEADDSRRAEVRVGIDEGDIRGADNLALQAAVDQVAALGGGTVHIAPGRYTMRNALRLRDHVRILGVKGETVLVA